MNKANNINGVLNILSAWRGRSINEFKALSLLISAPGAKSPSTILEINQPVKVPQ